MRPLSRYAIGIGSWQIGLVSLREVPRARYVLPLRLGSSLTSAIRSLSGRWPI